MPRTVTYRCADARAEQRMIAFVWTEGGELAHATVTVGGGWMLSKPSQ